MQRSEYDVSSRPVHHGPRYIADTLPQSMVIKQR